MIDVARATAAAPTFFEPARVDGRALIDGGVFAANPSLVAYVDALRAGEEVTLLASLGTGTGTEPIPYERARWWGQLEWARPLVGVVFDGIAETTEFSLDTLLGPTYVRLAPTLDEAQDDLDDASPENLAALRRAAERLIAERSAEIDRLAAALVA